MLARPASRVIPFWRDGCLVCDSAGPRPVALTLAGATDVLDVRRLVASLDAAMVSTVALGVGCCDGTGSSSSAAHAASLPRVNVAVCSAAALARAAAGCCSPGSSLR